MAQQARTRWEGEARPGSGVLMEYVLMGGGGGGGGVGGEGLGKDTDG